MKLSKNKIKQLLKVKNQTQKRVKKMGKTVRKLKKTVGRKKHVNLRNKTLKHVGGAGLTDQEYIQASNKLKTNLTANLHDFIDLNNKLTYDKVQTLVTISSSIREDIGKFLLLSKQNLTPEEIKVLRGNVGTNTFFINLFDTWYHAIRSIKRIQNKKKTDKNFKQNKITLIKKKTNDLLSEIFKTFQGIAGLKDVYENSKVAQPVSRQERAQMNEQLMIDDEFEKLQGPGEEEGDVEEAQVEEEPVEEEAQVAIEEPQVAVEEAQVAVEEPQVEEEPVVEEPVEEEAQVVEEPADAPLTEEEEAELASGFTEAEKNVRLANEELRNTLEHKTAALKYCAETDKDKEAIDEIVQVMELTPEESPVSEGEKLQAVEEKVNELSQKPCDPLVDIQNHVLGEIYKFEEPIDEPLTDAEYKKIVKIKEYVEQSIKKRENIVKSKKNKEKEIAKLTEMLQDIFKLVNAHNLQSSNEEEILTGLEEAKKAREQQVLAQGEFIEEDELPDLAEDAGTGAEVVGVQKKEIASLRTDIIDLIKNNPDIVIDKSKYGEIEDDVYNWAYTPDAEELAKFKEFKDYLQEQVKIAGQEMFGDIAAGDFEDFEQAINATQADFDILPDVDLSLVFTDDKGQPPPPPPPPPSPPLFVAEAKERLDPNEFQEIVRKRMVELEEQYNQDKVDEADVIAKYEGIIQNMKEEDRIKNQNFIETVRKEWDNTIKAQEAERNAERELLYNVLNQNEDTIKTLQEELAEKQTALEQNEQMEQIDNAMIEGLRTGIDDVRQKLRSKTEEFIKATEEWNQRHEEAEVTRQENIDELTTKLQETITQSNESKEKLEKILAERNALILKGRTDLKKQEELSEQLTKRIEELEQEKKLDKEELKKWNEMNAALDKNIQKNKITIDEQEQIKQRLAERIEEIKEYPDYGELESADSLAPTSTPTSTSFEPTTDSLAPTSTPTSTSFEPTTDSLAPASTSFAPTDSLAPTSTPTSTSTPTPTSTSFAPAPVQATTTEIGPVRNGVQEILVRIQYPIVPSGTTPPGPVMSVIGDASVSTEAAVVGVMGEQSTDVIPEPIPEPILANNPTFNPPQEEEEEEEENLLLGGKKSKNKHKTTRRKKHIYFTKDDFIAF